MIYKIYIVMILSALQRFHVENISGALLCDVLDSVLLFPW